jgi:hypothetical protein
VDAGSASRTHGILKNGVLIATLAIASILVAATAASATIAQKPDDPALSGTVAWGANGRVWAIARIGDVAYLGGNFTEAVRSDGMTRARNNLMAVDVVTGALLAWQPSVAGIVFDIAVDGSTLLVGGDFTSVNGIARSNFAAVDTSGAVEDWHLDAANQIRALTFSNGTLYLGGQFNFVEGQTRIRLAAVDLSTLPGPGGTPPLLDWTPSVNHSVRSIVVMPNGNILIGGVFDEITEQGSTTPDTTRPFIQALTPPGPGGGTFAQWDEHTVDFVWDMAMMPDGRVVVGRGGRKGGTVAAYTQTGDVTWHHGGNGDVRAVGFADGKVIAGGHFTMIGGGPAGQTHLPRLVAFDPAGGHLDTSWQPWPDSTKGVWSILGGSDKLLVGGDFTTMEHGADVANHFAQFTITPSA